MAENELFAEETEPELQEESVSLMKYIKKENLIIWSLFILGVVILVGPVLAWVFATYDTTILGYGAIRYTWVIAIAVVVLFAMEYFSLMSQSSKLSSGKILEGGTFAWVVIINHVFIFGLFVAFFIWAGIKHGAVWAALTGAGPTLAVLMWLFMMFSCAALIINAVFYFIKTKDLITFTRDGTKFFGGKYKKMAEGREGVVAKYKSTWKKFWDNQYYYIVGLVVAQVLYVLFTGLPWIFSAIKEDLLEFTPNMYSWTNTLYAGVVFMLTYIAINHQIKVEMVNKNLIGGIASWVLVLLYIPLFGWPIYYPIHAGIEHGGIFPGLMPGAKNKQIANYVFDGLAEAAILAAAGFAVLFFRNKLSFGKIGRE